MPDDGDDPDRTTVQDDARRRQRERAESVEAMLGPEGGLLSEATYPTTSEELAVEYGDQVIDLPNETESLGSVFDRLVDERFESPAEAREAILDEVAGDQAGTEEYTDGRASAGPTDEEASDPDHAGRGPSDDTDDRE